MILFNFFISPYYMNNKEYVIPISIILVNDYCHGLLGEKKVLWNYMLDGIPGLKPVDLNVLKTDPDIYMLNIPFEMKISKYIEKHYPVYKCIIQNGSYFNLIPSNKPRICLIQDNLRKMDRKSTIQESNFKKAEYIVVNSKETEDSYNERSCYKIPLCVDDKLFYVKDRHKLRIAYKFPQFMKIGIFVGALNEIKGWNDILQVIEIYQNIFWIIVSKNNDDENLEKHKNVRKYNKISQELLCDLYNVADFFIIGSPTETQCLSAIEACLCDIPIIMKKTGFVSDLTDMEIEQIGIIGNNFENAVKLIICDNFTFSPRNIILKYFSIEKMNEKWIKLINGIN